MDLQATDIGLFTVLVVLTAATLITNSLFAAVLVNSEKLTRNARALLFMVAAHVELCVVLLINWSVHISQNESLLTNDSNNTLEKQSDDAITASSEGLVLAIRCLLGGAVLWSSFTLLNITLNQYVYIEEPFWYDQHITTRYAMLHSVAFGVIAHVLCFIPMMMDSKDSNRELVMLIWFTALLFLTLSAIVTFSGRMLILANKHREKMREYNNVTLPKTDSNRFFILLVVGYTLAYITPSIVMLIMETLQMSNERMHLRILYVLGPLWFSLLFGSRLPKGFLTSVKLVVCCCLPIDESDKEPHDIDSIMRFAMMRLGQVMIKIDEQAVQKRYDTYMQRKGRITVRLAKLKGQNKEKCLRNYKSISNPELLKGVPAVNASYVKENESHRRLVMSMSDISPLQLRKVDILNETNNQIRPPKKSHYNQSNSHKSLAKLPECSHECVDNSDDNVFDQINPKQTDSKPLANREQL